MSVTPAQLRSTAEGLARLGDWCESAATRQSAANDEIRSAADGLTGAGSAPVLVAAARGVSQLQTNVGSVAEPLSIAAAILRRVSSEAGAAAIALAGAERDLAGIEQQLRQATWRPEVDPAEVARLQAARTTTRRRRDRVLEGWQESAQRLARQLDPIIQALHSARRSTAGIELVSPAGMAASGGRGSQLDGMATGQFSLQRLYALLSGATTGQSALDAMLVLPFLGRAAEQFRQQVAALPADQRLGAMLRWQSQVSRRLPLSAALGELQRQGLIDPSYTRLAGSDGRAPNLSAFSRLQGGLRVAGRVLAPVGLFVDGRTLLSQDSSVGDRVAAAAGTFSSVVGTLALVSGAVVVGPKLAIAAAVAGVGALVWNQRDTLTRWATNTWSWGSGVLGSAWGRTTEAASWGWNQVTDAASASWGWAQDTAADAWNWTTDTASGAWEWSRDTAADAWSWTTDTASGAWEWSRDTAADAWNWTKDTASDAWEWTTGTATDAWNWTTGTIASAWHWGRSAVEWTFDWVVDRVRSAVDVAIAGVAGAAGLILRGAERVHYFLRDYLPNSVFFGGRLLWSLREGRILDRATEHRGSPLEDPAALEAIFSQVGLPTPTTPAEVAAAFAAMDEVDARRLAREYPAVIGMLDGVPADMRHEANTIRLAEVVGELAQERKNLLASLATQQPGSVQQLLLLRDLRQLDDRLDSLATVQRALADVDTRQLLQFRPEEQGVAISTGPLEDATHVTTFVPGTFSSMGGIDGSLDDQDLLINDANSRESSGGHARHESVVWIDYNAPGGMLGLAKASAPDRAMDASRDLHLFIDGLAAANPGQVQHGSGHSYGSTVWGATLRLEDPPVSSVTLIAPPGAMAASVDDYDTDAHIYVVTGHGDVIHGVSAGSATANLGPDPTSPAFGAEVVRTGLDSGWHPYGDYVGSDAARQELVDIMIAEPSP